MNRLKGIIGLLRSGMMAWLIAASVIWTFLLIPYAIDAYHCKDAIASGESLQCLKPIAASLRADSNIATYATATVAAIIALQLGRRISEDGPSNGDNQTR